MAPASRTAPSRASFTCGDCDKTFSRKEYVERHRRLKHLNSRPFPCECGTSFARSDLLLRHRRGCDGVAKVVVPSVTSSEDEPPVKQELHAQQLPTPSSYSSPNAYASSASTSSNGPRSPIFPELAPPTPGSSSSSGRASPPTPFEPDVMQLAADMYLDPPFARDFTQDEILASEVLEEQDLLRSPQYSRPSPSLASNEKYLPWHGALSLENAGQEHSDLVSTWDPLESPNGIEFSHEAAALADYFNKGGVGGISALDLGFSSTPSLYSSELFEPQSFHESDRKFFLPNQKFCIGYMHPWHVPPLETLSRFAAAADKSFLPSMPIIHSPTMVLSTLQTHAAFALAVTGAALCPDGESFSNEMLVEKRVFLVRAFDQPGQTEEGRFALLQSILLYQLLGMFHRDPQQRALAHTFHAALILMMDKLDLPTKVSQSSLVQPYVGMDSVALEAAWIEWVKVETWRRVAFIVFLADLEIALALSVSPLLESSSMTFDLPSPDHLWSAPSSTAWLKLMTTSRPKPPIPFLSAVHALISSTCEPFSQGATMLTDIAGLTSFPLLILTRTLSFLQVKTEEVLASMDPFKNLLGGFGIADIREQKDRELLARIERGREVLKGLPGGERRGGGEGWFEDVMPNTAS